MSIEMLKWKNVEWSQVDTDSSGNIDDNEVAAAKKKFGITLWSKMDEAAFNNEKLLNHYIGKCAIGKFVGERSHCYKDLEEKIIKYGEELENLEKKLVNEKWVVAESTLYLPKQKNTQVYENRTNNDILSKINKLKQLIVSYASRIYGAYKMA